MVFLRDTSRAFVHTIATELQHNPGRLAIAWMLSSSPPCDPLPLVDVSIKLVFSDTAACQSKAARGTDSLDANAPHFILGIHKSAFPAGDSS